MTGTIKSYVQTRELHFEDSAVPPICLGEVNERVYYAFSDELTPASGGKRVTDDEYQALLADSALIKHVKQEAMRRILAVAPYWRQDNALADMYLLANKAELTDEERQRLEEAKQLWESIHHLRACSNDIEAALLQGELVDYMHDSAWARTTDTQ